MTSRHCMPGRPHATATLLALALGLGLAAPPAARADTWDDAQAAFADRDDGLGLQRLAQAAQEGDARAMHAWALALKHGPRLFPGRLSTDAGQAGHWFDRLARHCVLLRAQADGGTTGPADPACPAPPTRRAADPPPGASSSLGTRGR